jgi:hypothetical protein
MKKQVNLLPNVLIILLFLFLIRNLIAQQIADKTGLSKTISTTGVWDEQFFSGGFDTKINAVATAENGDIYVGGDFVLINGLVVNHIARWDGEEWHALGTGISGTYSYQTIYAIEIDGSNVYIGGSFQQAGLGQANNIAKWNGESWAALGNGTDGDVYSLESDNGILYVGGQFIIAGNDTVKHIAQWDGSAWSGLNTGLGGFNYSSVFSLLKIDDILYAGGNFILAGDDTLNRIAQWDGQSWSGLSKGMDNDVNALGFYNNQLYAGGKFKHAGNITANYIARWDGNAWDSTGININYDVNAITSANGVLYIGGRFYESDSNPFNKIAQWNGLVWSSLEDGLNADVYAMSAQNGVLYLGGDDSYSSTKGKIFNFFTTWQNNEWKDVGLEKDHSVDGEVYAIAIDGTDIYVGGRFITAGGDTMNNIAKWDGQKWSALGTGVSDKVNAILVHEGKIYVGGIFGRAGGISARRIAIWDGESWSACARGLNNPVYTLGALGNDIYAGGNFTKADDSLWVRHIARWDGVQWHDVGGDGSMDSAGGLDGYYSSYVSSMATDGDTLYVAGYFGRAFQSDGTYLSTHSIVKWDGQTWSAVAPISKYNVTVNALLVEGGQIYASVDHYIPGVGDAHSIFMWNGVEWTALGGDFSIPNGVSWCMIYTITKIGETIYAGGNFESNSDDNGVKYMAFWNGTAWKALDNPVNNYVYALSTDDNYIYAGGLFSIAGNSGSEKFGRYDPFTLGIADNSSTVVQEFILRQNYPNPFNPATTINYQLSDVSEVDLTIYNVLGQKVATLVSGKQAAGKHQVVWNAGHLGSGVYFYKLKTDKGQIDVKKLLLIK